MRDNAPRVRNGWLRAVRRFLDEASSAGNGPAFIMTPDLDVSLTGPVTLRSAFGAVDEQALGGRRVRLALAFLMLERGRPVNRDRLADILWPDRLPATWGSALRVTISKVRSALAIVLPDEGELVVHTPSGYQLLIPPGTDVVVDVDHARAAIDAGEVALANGAARDAAQLAAEARAILVRPFLSGDEGPWIDAIRAEQRDGLARSLELLARARLELREPAMAAAVAGEAVLLEPYRESAHRTLIAAHLAAGNRAEGLRVYERCRRLLAEELGVSPSPETEHLYVSLLGDEPAPPPRPIALPGELPLVGRERPLAVLKKLLDNAAAGSGGVVLITGEPGIGKTRLAREATRTAADAGLCALWGACREPEWTPPYGAIVDLLPDLHELAPSDVESLRDRLADHPAEGPASQVREDFRRLLLSVADRTPLLIVLDDLHWGDAGTLAVLRVLAPTLPRSHILVVATMRDDEVEMTGPVSAVIETITRSSGATRIELHDLDVDAVRQLVLSNLPKAPPWLGTYLATETGGNPFFVEAVLLHLIEEGTLDGAVSLTEPIALDVPNVVRDVIGRRLARLSEPCQRMLRTGSMFEAEFPLEVAASACDLDELSALDAVDEALAARLLVPVDGPDAYQFAHAIVRHTIADTVTPSRRLRLHRRVAEALEVRAGQSPTIAECMELAGQYHRSASLPGADRGVEPAVRAAGHAESAGAFDRAASYLRMALELLPADDARRWDIRQRLGLALIHASRHEEGAKLVLAMADEVAASGDRDTAARVIAEGAWQAELAGSSAVAFQLAAAGMEFVAPDRRDDVWARLYILDVRRREADEPHGLGLPLGTPERRQAARMLYADPRYHGGLVWAVWDSRAEILASGTDDVWALMMWAGKYREAMPELQRQAAAAEARGQITEAVHALAGAARCAVALGHLTDADEMTERARDLARRIDLRGSFALHLLCARDDLVHARDDGYDDFWEWSTLLTSERSDRAQRWAEAGFFANAARVFALEGRPENVAPMLDGVAEVLPLAPTWAVGTSRVVGDTAEAVFHSEMTNHLAAVEQAVREKLIEPDFRCPMYDPRHAMARVAAVAGRADEASVWFEESRRVCDDDGLLPLRAIIDYDEALMMARIGKRSDAERLGSAATAAFGRLGMVGWVRRTERLLLAF